MGCKRKILEEIYWEKIGRLPTGEDVYYNSVSKEHAKEADYEYLISITDEELKKVR